MAKFELSAFADEYSPNFDEQLQGLQQNGIHYMEIRGVDGKNISSLTIEEAKAAKAKLDAKGIRVSSIGSPLGKIGIHDDFEEHLVLLRHTIVLAKIFDTNRIRMFSFYVPQGENPADYREEVMEKLGRMLEIAQQEQILLCHENEKGIYGENAERCLEIQETFHGEIKCIFDHANFICCNVEPYPYAFEQLKSYIFYLHIKDATAEKQMTPAGDGIGRIPESLAQLNTLEKEYILTVEPHLHVFKGLETLEDAHKTKVANQYATSAEAFAAAVNGIKRYI